MVVDVPSLSKFFLSSAARAIANNDTPKNATLNVLPELVYMIDGLV